MEKHLAEISSFPENRPPRLCLESETSVDNKSGSNKHNGLFLYAKTGVYEIYTMKYARGFVYIGFVSVILLFALDSCGLFIHIIDGCFTFPRYVFVSVPVIL